MTRPYSPVSVPAASEDRSRWFLDSTPAGSPIEPGTNIAHVLRELLYSRRASMDRLSPPTVTIQLKEAVQLDNGAYVLADRGAPFTARIQAKSKRPGRRSAIKASCRTLDEFALGGEPWKSAPDDVIFDSLLATAAAHRLEGAALRDLNDVVSLLVLARAGATAVRAENLPDTVSLRVTA
jgi:hypothetical protein